MANDLNGKRGFLNSEYTERLGKGKYLLFREGNNFAQLQYMIDNEMTTEEFINTFTVKDDSILGFSVGCVSEYAGYHNIANGELEPEEPVAPEFPVINQRPTVSIDMNQKAEGEANPETGAPVFSIVALIAAAAVSFKK